MNVKKFKRIMLIAIAPMIVSLLVDYFIKLPGNTILILYIILYGIVAWIYKDEDSVVERGEKYSKLKVFIGSICAIISLVFLMLLKTSTILIASTEVKMILQSGLCLIVTIILLKFMILFIRK